MILFTAAAIASALRPGHAQTEEPIWAGVFTPAQAERGRAIVQAHCAECHRDNLTGSNGPALVGDPFMVNWEARTVQRLYRKIRDTMPGRGRAVVSNSDKIDSVAFILQQNGFPAGANELTEDDGLLASLRMVPKGGPGRPRAGALVQTIGCLEEGGPGKWAASRSTEPQVTTLDPLTGDEKSSAVTAEGTNTIQLLSVFPNPTAMKGHKVIAKGLFITTPSDLRINVISLESLAPSCGQ